jgi:hypothetical protein
VSSRLHNQQVAEVIVAKRVSEITLGIDVAKDECVVCDWHAAKILTLPNQKDSLKL